MEQYVSRITFVFLQLRNRLACEILPLEDTAVAEVLHLQRSTRSCRQKIGSTPSACYLLYEDNFLLTKLSPC